MSKDAERVQKAFDEIGETLDLLHPAFNKVDGMAAYAANCVRYKISEDIAIKGIRAFFKFYRDMEKIMGPNWHEKIKVKGMGDA